VRRTTAGSSRPARATPRLLQFEGADAESFWTLDLPAEFRQVDYGTFSDVILHIRYTAREGGAQLRAAAVANLRNLFPDARTTGLGLL
jgi:hypothetical protein